MKVFLQLTRRRGVFASGVLVFGLALATTAVANVRWRVHVLFLHMTGRIPDIETRQLVNYMMPGSDQWMWPLIETRNPYAVVRNYRTTPADIQAGAQLFRSQCAACHAPDGSGGAGGPGLVRGLKHGESDWAVYRTVWLGMPNTTMGPHPLPDTQLWQLVAFVRSLGAAADGVKAANHTHPPSNSTNVTYAEIAAGLETSADWLTYSGSYTSWRHSSLNGINLRNVNQLTLRWVHQLEGNPAEVQMSPLVRNGVMFVTAPPAKVLALDAATGKQIWAHDHKLSGKIAVEFGMIKNRGVALLDDKVYFGTADAHLVALAADTGKVVWETAVSPDSEHYGIGSAPLAYRDLVVTGVGVVERGRGFVVACDAKTGKERWRFHTIPARGEPGNDTWAGDSWREGGGPTWLTGSYDPRADILVWAVGNPKPDYDAASRKGDNLYTNSAVALRGSTGELLWHFQFTPADDHDWDSNQIPMLADFASPGGTQKRVLWANRNGFYYVLDRTSGKFIKGVPYARQTWCDGLDAYGRPKPPSTPGRTREGFMLYPGNVGATNWWSPSFDRELNLVYVPVLEQGMVYFTSASSTPRATGAQFYTAVRALDATTGRLVWEHRREPRTVDNRMGGVLSTSGGLLFGSDQSAFFALNSRNGDPLWSVETGGKTVAAPVTYAANGEQHVVIAAGRNLMAFAAPKERCSGTCGGTADGHRQATLTSTR